MTLLDLDDLKTPYHEQIDTLRTVANADTPPDVRDYYDGNQPSVATSDQMAALGPRADRPYVENVLKQCTDTMAGRLLFRQFLCEDGPAEQEWLEGFARRNQMGEQVITNTVRVLVDGNNGISLSWHKDDPNAKGRPMVHQEPWWDGREGVFIEVGDDGLEQWAVKEWIDLQKRRRRTVYLPDRIMRFVQVGGDDTGGTVDESTRWQTYPDDDQYLVWWTRTGEEGGDPLGVPMIHFGNTVTADRLYGASVIEPLLGLQDALNGTIFDIVAAQALNAFPIYTATGVQQGGDYTVGPGRRWEASDAAAAFGVLSPGSMDAILDGYRAIRAAIANQFPVSEHLITGGQWPSGMALQRAEGPMISMVKLMGETFAPSWVRVAHRAMELENTFGEGGLNENHMIQIEYAPAEQLDEGTIMEIERERVGLYADLARLPRALMLKTGIVDTDEANAILAEQQAQREMFLSNLDGGGFGQDYEGDERKSA